MLWLMCSALYAFPGHELAGNEDSQVLTLKRSVCVQLQFELVYRALGCRLLASIPGEWLMSGLSLVSVYGLT